MNRNYKNHSLPPADEVTYAKQQLRTAHGGYCSLLGLQWNKSSDTISVTISTDVTANPSRKSTERYICQKKIGWDVDIDSEVKKKLVRWERDLPNQVTTERSLVKFRENIDSIELHAFGDASNQGVSTAVYAIVHQPSGVSLGLVAAKSRLAKQGLITIPRLELVSAHMAANLVSNVEKALGGFPITVIQEWLDSTVTLQWINGGGEYKQFVANRI
ncbi:Hypothetical predicted protein [Paramuricea clavata]|uniref:Uncharacterized protein n=1 Tax=Paramuricea clavata TaxID=317549 RepID=A0A7D9EPH7_PARCT|nr:Hypothetical predicted protein [Paramuricea clavata]